MISPLAKWFSSRRKLLKQLELLKFENAELYRLLEVHGNFRDALNSQFCRQIAADTAAIARMGDVKSSADQSRKIR